MNTEYLKYNSSNKLVTSIVKLLALIWTLLIVPTTWLHASINCLYKKGARNLAANYRGLSIGANMSRIIAKIITNRFQDAYEKQMSEAQFGFRKGRSTTDGIFILNTIIAKRKEPLIAIYIDLTAAYDHIRDDLLFRVIELQTGASKLVNVPRNCMRIQQLQSKVCNPNLTSMLAAAKAGKSPLSCSTGILILS